MILYLSGTILAFFLSFLLITKKGRSPADYVLMAWLAVTGFHLFTYYLFFTQQDTIFPMLIVLGFPLPLVQGPFLYLYTTLQTSSGVFRKRQLLHFVPALLCYLLYFRFYFLPFEQQAEVFRLKGQGFEVQMLISDYAIYISGVVYVILSLKRLLNYRKKLVHQFSNTEKINFNWLLYLIIWIAAIWVVVLFVQESKLVFGVAALFVLWLGYFGIRQVQVFSKITPELQPELPMAPTPDALSTFDNTLKTIEPNPSTATDEIQQKYQKSALSDKEATGIHERLKQLMYEEKPFTNPDLTLNELAKTLDVHPNHLSQVINSKENKNFYDLVNEKRVKEFIRVIKQPDSQQFTLLALAFECGFNSKASFNRNFKKHTGLTPSDYMKKQLVGQVHAN